MLYAKFHDNRTSGCGEEDFFKVFTIYGHGGHLGHVTWTFVPPSQGGSGELNIKAYLRVST